MRPSTLFTTIVILLSTPSAQTSPPKRGLVHIPSPSYPTDDHLWIHSPHPPTWYYNYHATPSPAYAHNPSLHFVPMLWGASASAPGIPFLAVIKAQLASGAHITHVLSFNEPDGPFTTGGSAMSPALAAACWKAELEPLRKLGINVGAPAVTGGERGWCWLENWFHECDGGCSPDFMAVHWYGDVEGLMAHVGRVVARWPGRPVWVTEFGFPERGLRDTQRCFNASVRSFDGWGNVERYAYFGAFRSDVSNVGENAAMLNEDGKLTDIGSWYLGGGATGVLPSEAAWNIPSADARLQFVLGVVMVMYILRLFFL